MMDILNYMTDEEKVKLKKNMEKHDAAMKVDQDAILLASPHVDFNIAIHINELKCDLCDNIGLKSIPLSSKDYVEICSIEREEERRSQLSKIVLKKIIQLKDFKKIDDYIANKQLFTSVLECLTNKSEEEPVMNVVKEADAKNGVDVGGVAVERLKSIIERVERLEGEKKGLADDIRDIFAEAKSAGFDVKALRTVLKIHKMDPSDREEQEHWLETYKKALDL